MTARERARQLAAQFNLTPEEVARFLDTAKGLDGASVDALDEAMRRNVANARWAPASQLPSALSLLVTHLRDEKIAPFLQPADRETDDGTDPHAGARKMIAQLTEAGDADAASRLQAGLDEVLSQEKEAHSQEKEDQP
jgi:hypothetical protein